MFMSLHTVLKLVTVMILQDILEDDVVKNILYLSDLLEMCQFKIFWQQVSVLASSAEIRDILVRIWIQIRRSIPLTNGSGSGWNSFFSDFKDANKKCSYFFSCNLPTGTLNSVFKKLIFAKILC